MFEQNQIDCLIGILDFFIFAHCGPMSDVMGSIPPFFSLRVRYFRRFDVIEQFLVLIFLFVIEMTRCHADHSLFFLFSLISMNR